MLNDSGASLEFQREFGGIRDWPEVAVEDQVALIGVIFPAVRALPNHILGAQRLEKSCLRTPAEWQHFNGKYVQRSQSLRQFAFVDDNNLKFGSLCNQLLPQ